MIFRNDRTFSLLLFLEWLATVAVAYWMAPETWAGARPSLHPHVSQAAWLGLLASGAPAAAIWLRAGCPWVKYLVAAAQISTVGLFVHVTGGRIESHFFYFGSLAALVAYRDWRVIVMASAVIAGDHAIRGWWFPVSLMGADAQASISRIAEHAWWVVFEDIFLIRFCRTASIEWERIQAQSQTQEQDLNRSRERSAVLAQSAAGLTALSSDLEAAASGSLTECGHTLARGERMAAQFEAMTLSAKEMANHNQAMAHIASTVAGLAFRSVQATDASERELAKLDRSASEIGRIIETIQNMTFQINLLAINANIEAARAGSAGLGFAVVAAEVRRLAQDSAESTRKIQSRLEAIQGNSESGVSSISQAASMIRELAAQVDTAMETSAKQGALVREVMNQCGLTQAASRETSESMLMLSAAGKSTQESAQVTSKAAQSLRELATVMMGKEQ